MKKIFSLGLAVLLHLSCFAIPTVADTATTPKDIVIAPGAVGNTVILSGTLTPQQQNADAGVFSKTTFDNKNVFSLTCVNDDNNTTTQYSGTLHVKGINADVTGYSYILANCYISTPEGFDSTYSTHTASIDYVNGAWKTWAAEEGKTTGDFFGQWNTWVIPIGAADLENGKLSDIELRLLGWAKAAKYDGATIYIEAIALSADKTIDMADAVPDPEDDGNGSTTPNYTKTDYSVPFDAFFGGVPGTTVDNAATFDGKNVVKLSKGTGLGSSSNWNDPANDWPITVLGEDQSKGYGDEALTKPINVRLGDYKYIVIKCYYDLNTLEWPTNKVPSLQIKQADDAKPWASFTAKSVASSGALANAVVREDRWQYFVFDMTTDTFTSMVNIDTTKYPNGFDSEIKSMQLYMFANGGILNSALGDDDAVYIEYFTFTNDYQNLLNADKQDNQQNNNQQGGTNNGDTTTKAPDTTTAPKDDSTTTAAPTEEKKGCGSAIGGSVMILALIGSAGALIVDNKRRK